MATRHVSINDGEHRRQQRKWRKHSASNKNTEPNRSSGTSFLSLSSIPDFKRSMSAEISFSCFFSCSLFCRSDASCSFSSWKQNVFVFFFKFWSKTYASITSHALRKFHYGLKSVARVRFEFIHVYLIMHSSKRNAQYNAVQCDSRHGIKAGHMLFYQAWVTRSTITSRSMAHKLIPNTWISCMRLSRSTWYNSVFCPVVCPSALLVKKGYINEVCVT